MPNHQLTNHQLTNHYLNPYFRPNIITTMLESFRSPDAPPINFKTDEELRFIIDNREKYLPESVLGAAAVLKERGKELSEEEDRVVREDMQARLEIANSSPAYTSLFSDSYKNCLVEDPEAYQFYSRRIIKIFTFFFGVFFGSIMMAINIGKTKNQAGVFSVLLFGLFLTIIESVIGYYSGGGTGVTIIVAFINSYLIDYLFWDKYIGNSTLYTARKYWVPLIVGILIYAGIVAMIVASGVPLR